MLEYVDADGSHLIEYTEDGEQEYLQLGGENKWRKIEWDVVNKRKIGMAGTSSSSAAGVMAKEEPEYSDLKIEVEDEEDENGAALRRVEEAEAEAAAEEEKEEEKGEAKAKAENGESSNAAAAAAAAAADEWKSRGPRLETALTLHALRSQMPVCEYEVSEYGAPHGWYEHKGNLSPRRRIAPRWIRKKGAAAASASSSSNRTDAVTGRAELEDLLEEEAKATGDPSSAPWLGTVTANGTWEIRGRQANDALEWIVGELVGEGLVKCIPAEDCGKGSGLLLCAANLYVRGEPFPRGGGKAKDDDDGSESEEELCDFELQRKKNIERNQELLRQLGLA